MSSETYLAESDGGIPASVQPRSCIRVQEGTGQNYLARTHGNGYVTDKPRMMMMMFRYVTLQHRRDRPVLELSCHAVTSINHVDQTLCWGWLNVISGHSSSPCCRHITLLEVKRIMPSENVTRNALSRHSSDRRRSWVYGPTGSLRGGVEGKNGTRKFAIVSFRLLYSWMADKL